MVLNEETVSSMETVSFVLSNFTSFNNWSVGFPAVRCYRWMDPITGYTEDVYLLFRISEVFVRKWIRMRDTAQGYLAGDRHLSRYAYIAGVPAPARTQLIGYGFPRGNRILLY